LVTPRFITLEGGEGTGKSTQAKRLADMLQSRSITAVVTREPGGSPGAEQIRRLLVEGDTDRWDGRTETLLVFAGRIDHIERTIKPAMNSGKWVISDRFTDSTYVYQGIGRGVDRETIRRIESVAIGDFKPDLTLVLDLPVTIGLQRAKARQTSENRFEGFDIDFHEKLRSAYRDIAIRHADRCVLLDATGSVEEVAKAIWGATAKRFGL
jgi:dTMP kinase